MITMYCEQIKIHEVSQAIQPMKLHTPPEPNHIFLGALKILS